MVQFLQWTILRMLWVKGVFSLYLSIYGLRKGPGKFLTGVLESHGKVLDFFQWKSGNPVYGCLFSLVVCSLFWLCLVLSMSATWLADEAVRMFWTIQEIGWEDDICLVLVPNSVQRWCQTLSFPKVVCPQEGIRSSEKDQSIRSLLPTNGFFSRSC